MKIRVTVNGDERHPWHGKRFHAPGSPKAGDQHIATSIGTFKLHGDIYRHIVFDAVTFPVSEIDVRGALAKLTTWTQGAFIDGPKYANRSESWKAEQQFRETYLVRRAPMENAICHAFRPDEAIWIAERLNRAALLEPIVEALARFYRTHHHGTPEEQALQSELLAGAYADFRTATEEA